MKKVLWGIGIFLALLPTAYVAYARYMIRGVRIYLVGTEKGAFLASTWQWALLAAIVLWLPIIIAVWAAIAKKIRSRREIAIPQYEVVSPTQTTRGVIEARGKAQKEQATELIEPAAARAETELIEPASAATRGNTDLLQPIAPQAETVLLRSEEPRIEPAVAVEIPAVPVEEKITAPSGATEVIGEEIPVTKPMEEEMPAAEPVAEEMPAAEEPAETAEPETAAEPAVEEIPVEEVPVAEAAMEEPSVEETPVAEPVATEIPAAADAAGETVLLQPEMPVETAPRMRFCGQCGTPVQGKFCSHCGAKTE